MLFDCLRTSTGSIQDFRLVLSNRKAEELVGMSEQKLLSRTWTDLFANTLPDGLRDYARRVVATGEPYETEVHYPATAYANEGWYALTLQKYGDGLAASFADITAAKRQEQKLNTLIDTLQRSNQNLERFAYVASHDLQEPLRKILSFGEVLRHQPAGAISEHSADLIGRMQAAAERMNRLIRDLLLFSRLSTQQLPFQLVNLSEVVRDVLTDLETAIQTKQAQVDVTELPVVPGDPLQLRQLVQNLLSNALKFVKPAHNTISLIRIDCELVSGSQIHSLPGTSVSDADTERSFFAISVSDNGIGFDEKYLDRMFTIFQRLHNRNEYEGTGIGLTIVKRVIDNHQGYINAQSQPGAGATFTVYLPAQ